MTDTSKKTDQASQVVAVDSMDQKQAMEYLDQLKKTDFTKQQNAFLGELKNNSDLKKIGASITPEHEKKAKQLFQSLQSIAKADPEKLFERFSKMGQGLDQYAFNFKEGIEWDAAYKKQPKETQDNLKSALLRSQENLDIQGMIAASFLPQEARVEISQLFALSFDEKKIAQLKDELQTQQGQASQEVKQFVNAAQDQKTIEITKYLASEIRKEFYEPASAQKNAMQPNQDEDVENGGRGNLTEPASRFDRLIDWLDDLFPKLCRVINRCTTKFPTAGEIVCVVISYLIAMLLNFLKIMLPFELLRTYGVGSLCGLAFNRVNGTLANSTILPAGFRPGEWNDEQGSLNVAGGGIYAITTIAFFVYLGSTVLYKYLTSYKNTLANTLLISAIAGLSLISAVLLAAKEGDVSSYVTICDMFCVSLSLPFRCLFSTFLVSISLPPFTSKLQAFFRSGIYSFPQIPLVKYMQSATKIGAGVYGKDAAWLRVWSNSAAEPVNEIAHILVSPNRREGAGFQILSSLKNPTPGQKDPVTKKVKRTLKLFGENFVIVNSIYASIYLIAISIATMLGLTDLSQISFLIYAVLTIMIGVVGMDSAYTSDDDEDVAISGEYTANFATNMNDRGAEDRSVRYQNKGKRIRKDAIKKHISEGKPYYIKATGRSYLIDSAGYGDIDFDTYLQMTEDQSNRRVRYVDLMVSKNGSRYHLPIPLNDLPNHIQQNKPYKTNKLSVNYFQGQSGYGDIDFEIGLQSTPQSVMPRETAQVQTSKNSRNPTPRPSTNNKKTSIAVVNEGVLTKNQFSVLNQLDEENNIKKKKPKKISTSSNEGSLLDAVEINGVRVINTKESKQKRSGDQTPISNIDPLPMDKNKKDKITKL